MPLGDAPADAVELSDADNEGLAALEQFQREESGYSMEQATKPQTLGVGLNDSPAGLLAWIVEKFRTWSDCDGHPENVFTRDQLLTNVTLVLDRRRRSRRRRGCTGRTSTSGREPRTSASRPASPAIPKEILRFPRAWVEQRYNVTYWADMPRGGHFAAMEQPELFVDDLRSFFATIR